MRCGDCKHSGERYESRYHKDTELVWCHLCEKPLVMVADGCCPEWAAREVVQKTLFEGK